LEVAGDLIGAELRRNGIADLEEAGGPNAVGCERDATEVGQVGGHAVARPQRIAVAVKFGNKGLGEVKRAKVVLGIDRSRDDVAAKLGITVKVSAYINPGGVGGCSPDIGGGAAEADGCLRVAVGVVTREILSAPAGQGNGKAAEHR